MNVWASGPDVAEAACLRGAGFRPLGRVTGCIVLNFAWWNDEEIAAPRRMRVPYPKEFSLNLHRRSEAYARLLYQGRRAAAERMAARCAALDGDGVVGVAIDVAPYIGDKRALQFTATGTAVRAAGSLRTSSPFLAGVSAQDFTKLMMAKVQPEGQNVRDEGPGIQLARAPTPGQSLRCCWGLTARPHGKPS
jgi:hypothetical protein